MIWYGRVEDEVEAAQLREHSERVVQQNVAQLERDRFGDGERVAGRQRLLLRRGRSGHIRRRFKDEPVAARARHAGDAFDGEPARADYFHNYAAIRRQDADFVDERDILVAPRPALAFPLFYPEHVPAEIVPPVLAVGVLRETRAAPVKRDRRAAGVRRCGKRHIRPAKLDEYLARTYLMHANALDERRSRGSFSRRRGRRVSFAA